VLAGVHPAQRERVDPRAELRQHRGQQRQGRRKDEEDAEHDPERHRAEGRAGDEHHRRERDQHGQPGEEDGLAGGVHRHGDGVARLELRAEERAAEAVHDEEGIVDPERQREHEREVHRPDRDLEAVREQREQTGGGDESEDRQQQRQPGGDERAEREHEDRHRHGPRKELRLQHGVAVGGVEVAPHPGGARERDADGARAGVLELRLERAGGGDHRGRITRGARHDDRGVSVGGDARARARRHDGADAGARAQDLLDTADGEAEAAVARGEARRVDDDHQGRAREARKVPLDERARLHRLRAVRLPAGAGERGLDLRREDAERDREDRPAERHRADVVGGEAAEPADRADGLRVLERPRSGAGSARENRHRSTPPTSSLRLRSCA
jgi:hypothetical protein